jgi:hypothetical protein
MSGVGEIPESAYPRCMFCGAPIHSLRLALQEVHGYTRHRDAGGANHIIRREETGKIVGAECGCAGRVQRGDPLDQGTLV